MPYDIEVYDLSGKFLHRIDIKADVPKFTYYDSQIHSLSDGSYLYVVPYPGTDASEISNARAVRFDENGDILYYTAAMWFWGSVNSTIQYCEIAGQKNVGDGMAIDFDSYSHNCTYQYIYSHDNMRFICNCPNHSGHNNNTVRYCLSVNDNGGRSRLSANPGEHGLKFYNNTIVNCADFYMIDMYDSVIANNIIAPADGYVVVCDTADYFRDGNVFANNCYYNTVNPFCDLFSKNTVPGFVGNDLTLLESADYAASVSDASDDVKAISDFITESLSKSIF